MESKDQLDECKNKLVHALKMMKIGRRLDAQEILEESIVELESMGVTDDYLKAKSLLADLLDDMGYLEEAVTRRSECIDFASATFGDECMETANLLLKQINTLWTLLDKSEKRSQIFEHSKHITKLVGRTVKVLKAIPDFPDMEGNLTDLHQKLTYCQLLITNIPIIMQHMQAGKSRNN